MHQCVSMLRHLGHCLFLYL